MRGDAEGGVKRENGKERSEEGGRTRAKWAFTKSIAYKLSRDFSFSSFPGA